MREARPYTKLHIYNFGPFKEAHIELAPLMIFIGKNSLGKSMLLYLIWVLETTPMDYKALSEVIIKEGAEKVAEECVRRAKNGEELVKPLRRLLLLFLKAFPQAWSKSLEYNLHSVFGVKVDKLIRIGTPGSKIIIESNMGKLEIAIENEKLAMRWIEVDESIIDNIKVKFEGRSLYNLMLRGRGIIIDVSSSLEVLTDILPAFERLLLYEILDGIAGSSEGLESLLVDGRAGIIRTLLTAYPGVSRIIREALSADFEFIDNVYQTARDLMEGNVDLQAPAFSLLLQELGFKPSIIEEFGIPRVYIETWAGQRLPLERAPSGIRETIPVLLSLLSKNTSIIYVEEPEAHLHPKAIRLVPRLMAYAINKLGKRLRITTHSDILISQINNLIAMSASPEGAKELGYEPYELLKPELVRAYWLRRAEEGDHVEVVELTVKETGFDEVEFAEVAEDLFVERGEVYRFLKEKKGGM